MRAVQARVARVAVSASAARGQGTGVVKAAREHLTHFQLGPFAVRTAGLFQARLDASTTALAKALPKGSRHWGLSRKLLNIFLRDALYNQYLAAHYRLGRAEGFLEIPLDSISAGRLWAAAEPGQLPRWRSVRDLTAAESGRYQAFATTLTRGGLARVHLDTFWWGER